MSTMGPSGFVTVDIVIFILLVLVSISIGLYFAFRNRHNNTTESYFLGNRRLKTIPVAVSFVVTFQSSILVLGFPAESYFYGMQYGIQVIGIMSAYCLASILVVPIFHPLKVTSVYQYYTLRYKENSVRYMAVVGGMLYYLLYIGTVLYGTALALETVANLPLWSTVVIFTVVSVLYTSLGGIQAVIWTDVFQSAVMLIGIIAVLIRSTIAAGGSSNVLRLGESRFNFFEFDPDPTKRHTFWTLILGSFCQFLHITLSQASIQRINSTPTLRSAKIMMYVSGPIFSFTWILALFEGVTLYAYYVHKGCDPMASGQISNMNKLIPYSIVYLFNDMPGFSGMVIAALSAASLSTISSGLSSLAAVAYIDIIKQFKPDMSESSATNVSKVLVVIFGLLGAGVSYVLMHSQGPLGQIVTSFASAVDGPFLGLYFTSIFFRRAKPKAMLFATLVGIGLIGWISTGQNFSASIPSSPYLPLAPTTTCNQTKLDNHTNHDPLLPNSGDQYTESIFNTTFTGNSHVTTETPSKDTDRTALQSIYSISYMYFSPIGFITVVVIGVLLSLIGRSRKDPLIDEGLLFSLKMINKNERLDRSKNIDDSIDMEELQPMSDQMT